MLRVTSRIRARRELHQYCSLGRGLGGRRAVAAAATRARHDRIADHEEDALRGPRGLSRCLRDRIKAAYQRLAVMTRGLSTRLMGVSPPRAVWARDGFSRVASGQWLGFGRCRIGRYARRPNPAEDGHNHHGHALQDLEGLPPAPVHHCLPVRPLRPTSAPTLAQNSEISHVNPRTVHSEPRVAVPAGPEVARLRPLIPNSLRIIPGSESR
jgi:hypothetical protein